MDSPDLQTVADLYSTTSYVERSDVRAVLQRQQIAYIRPVGSLLYGHAGKLYQVDQCTWVIFTRRRYRM
jgi:hypothetical protein